MPVIGFDDERVRDKWVEEEVERAVWLSVGRPGPTQEALTALRDAVEAFVKGVVEASRLLLEALAEIGEAAASASTTN